MKNHFLNSLFLYLGIIVMVGSSGSFPWEDDLNLIRERIVQDILSIPVNDKAVSQIIQSIQSDGSWKEINYTDTSRTGFQHAVHLDHMVEMARAFQNPESEYYHNARVDEVLISALDFWLAHDFICDNWWWNQIGTPDRLVRVLLLTGDQWSAERVAATVKIVDRSNLNASGARPSGDRIKMAGILAKKLLFLQDKGAFNEVIQVIEGEIKFSEGRGMQVDYSFHHRLDRVNNTLSYGLGYADAFAEWAQWVRGTRYEFSKSSIHLLVDYYLDGICRMLAYGKYPDPGAKNRSVTRPGSLQAYGVHAIDHLLNATDYRSDELQAIRDIRLGKLHHQRTFNTFFWHSEYMSHQRPQFFASARMYSTRNQNMEYPYNSEGLKNHYFGDGAHFISRTGQEYYNIFPVWDWRRIPGTTVVQVPEMPPDTLVREMGVSEFVGGVTDGHTGTAAFDYIKIRDSLKARKAWFFFDDAVVCLGAGISSASAFPVNTTLNQSLLHGTVYLSDSRKFYPMSSEVQQKLEDIHWVWHDSVAYLFPRSVRKSFLGSEDKSEDYENQSLHISNQQATGSWYSINHQSDSSRDTLQEKVFKLWWDHGVRPENSSYEYYEIPGVSVTDVENRDYTDIIKTLVNNTSTQAVQHRIQGVVQAVFYEAGSVKISDQITITTETPGMFLVRYRNNKIWEVAVSDPTRAQTEMRWSLSQNLVSTSAGVEIQWDEEANKANFTVVLPDGDRAGESVIITF